MVQCSWLKNRDGFIFQEIDNAAFLCKHTRNVHVFASFAFENAFL